MDRRTFLSLVASAPIAALAPWPSILQQQTIMSAASGPATSMVTSGGNGYVLNPPILVPWDPAHLDLERLRRYAQSIEREVAIETLGCDSLNEYLVGPQGGSTLQREG